MHYKGVHPRNWTYTQQKRPYLEGSTHTFSKAPRIYFWDNGIREAGKPFENFREALGTARHKKNSICSCAAAVATHSSQPGLGAVGDILLICWWPRFRGRTCFRVHPFTWGSWWFQNIFYVHPELWGRFPSWPIFFGLGWKAPTSQYRAISGLCWSWWAFMSILDNHFPYYMTSTWATRWRLNTNHVPKKSVFTFWKSVKIQYPEMLIDILRSIFEILWIF